MLNKQKVATKSSMFMLVCAHGQYLACTPEYATITLMRLEGKPQGFPGASGFLWAVLGSPGFRLWLFRGPRGC